MNKSILHLANPANEWENASPIGNGTSGMMVFGGVASDKLTLNEESIWSGGEVDTKVEGYAEKIRYIRQLFIDDREEEADAWTTENMSECFNRIKSYEYAGIINVRLHENGECENYRRDLDQTAFSISRTQRTAENMKENISLHIRRRLSAQDILRIRNSRLR